MALEAVLRFPLFSLSYPSSMATKPPSQASNPVSRRLSSKYLTKLRPANAKQVIDDGLAVLLSSAKMLKTVSGVAPLPYISSAAGSLVVIIECIQLVQKNNHDYADLINRIRVPLEILNEEFQVHPQSINERFETFCREFCVSLENSLTQIRVSQYRDRKYMVQLLKSASIRDNIDRLKTQLEDARMNFLTSMTIDTNRNVALGFAKISQENHHVLSAVSSLTQATGPENTMEVNDHTSELQTVYLRDWISTGPPVLTEPRPWVSGNLDATVYEQSAKMLNGNVKCIVRTFRGHSESQKWMAYVLWKEELDFLAQCRVSFLPQLFGISRSEHSLSLYFHADDESDIPVATYMRGLDSLMRVLFRSKYAEALSSSQSFMRITTQRSLGVVGSPTVDCINLVGAGGHIKVMNWSRADKESFYAGQPSSVLKHTANLDLSIWPTAIKSLDLFALLRSIMTKETFGVSAHFMKINDKKLSRGLGNVHCTCCDWDLPASSLRASRSPSPALFTSWIGAALDYLAMKWIFGIESGQQKHDVLMHQHHGNILLRVFQHTLQPGMQVITCEVRCRSDRQIHHSYLAIPHKDHEEYYFVNSFQWDLELEYTPKQIPGEDHAETGLSDSAPFSVSLALLLTPDAIPLLDITISCGGTDYYYPLHSLQILSCGINLKLSSPTVGFSYPHVYLREVLALCDHLNVDLTNDLLPWLGEEFGQPTIYSDEKFMPVHS